MPFRPNVNDTLTVDGTVLRFTQHPAVTGMPYGQSGRKGTVYQVREEGGNRLLRAFKVFHRAFQEPRLAVGAQRLQSFASLPGLQVCARRVLAPETHPDLVAREPDLAYAVLMPWISGTTWQEIVVGRKPLKPEQSQALAQRFLHILATMEAQGVAHCDLSGPNVMLTIDAPGGPAVQLVDVEDLYAPELPPPQKSPAGSP
ncbi:MAG TPA: hypothetical protein VGW38_12195, partial [Chloroflexota bacterium]|nr:hypothetical protein [Chloroflexota bacterium]